MKKIVQPTNWATYNSQATEREQALINLAKAKAIEAANSAKETVIIDHSGVNVCKKINYSINQ